MVKERGGSGTTLASLPDDLLLAVLCRLKLDDRLHAGRACRCLRLASSALEWRVRLDLQDEPHPDPRLRSFVEWATGGPGSRPRNVTHLRLAHQVMLWEGASAQRSAHRLPSRSPPGPEGHHGSPLALSCLSAIPTLVALDLAVCHPHSLAGLGELMLLRQLRVVAPISEYFAKSWVPERASSYEVASRVLAGSLVSMQGLGSLDLTAFLERPYRGLGSSHGTWLQRLTQLTHLKIQAIDVTDAVWAVPRLEHLHIEDVLYMPKFPSILDKLSLGSSQLSRLTLEGCSLYAGQSVLPDSLRALELLKCQGLGRLPSALAPSRALSQLSIVPPEWESSLETGLLKYVSGLSGVTRLHVSGVLDPIAIRLVKLPDLRALKLGLRKVDLKHGYIPGYVRDCFTHLSRLEDLTLEVPLECSSEVPTEQLGGWLPRGCRTCVVESDALAPWYSEEEEEWDELDELNEEALFHAEMDAEFDESEVDPEDAEYPYDDDDFFGDEYGGF